MQPATSGRYRDPRAIAKPREPEAVAIPEIPGLGRIIDKTRELWPHLLELSHQERIAVAKMLEQWSRLAERRGQR